MKKSAKKWQRNECCGVLIVGDDEQRWFVIVGDSDGSRRERGARATSNSVQLVTDVW